MRLTAKFVKAVEEPGKYLDAHGNGLMLQVQRSKRKGWLAKSWTQRLTIHGRRRDIGLGTFPPVALSEARKIAFENRNLARAGDDPRAMRSGRTVPTFADAIEAVISIHEGGWKDGGKSVKQWRASLRDYAVPRLGRMPVDRITTADIMAVLLPIWQSKHQTARRVRQRIGAVMKWSIAEGHRTDNPASEALGAALPKVGKHSEHHRALPHREVARAIRMVRVSGAYRAAKLCFEFVVLTAARSGEGRLARWDEFEFDSRIWTIPACRMKVGRAHRVPLSSRAVAVLAEARTIDDESGLVFPSPRGRPLSDSTLSKLLRDLDIEAVPHGFRSSFRDWASERTNTPHAVMESALAHTIRDKVEAAYARSDLLEKRAILMESWAAYLDAEAGHVVSLDRRRTVA